MYTFPATKSSANYVQLAGNSYYSSRRNGPALGIVLHVTAGLQDLDLAGSDGSAEGTAKWAVNREVSWHAGVDSDSIVPCLPSTYTGWHAKNYNSRTIGIEISNVDARWDNKPAEWVTRTLRNAARAAAAYVKEYNFPLVLATQSQVDSAVSANRKFGFTYHSYLSDIRVDPGKTFPWARFIAMVRDELAGVLPSVPKPTAPGLLVIDGSLGPKTIRRWQEIMKKQGHAITVDGTISRESLLTTAVQKTLKAKGIKDAENQTLVVDGRGLGTNSGQRYPEGAGTSTDTIEALCKYLGIRVKGHFQEGDEYTIKILQKKLNTGKF